MMATWQAWMLLGLRLWAALLCSSLERIVPLPLAVRLQVRCLMLVVEWDSQSGWKIPRIVPFGSLALSPAANVLHYSSTCFEGMKAYRGIDGKIRLFRPSMNMARLLQLIWKLIKIDQHFISK